MGEHCSLAITLFLLLPCPTSQVWYRSHTSISVGCVTGNHFPLGFVQEYLCTLLPPRKTNWIIPFWWLAGAEALHGMSSYSHRSRNSQRMLDHLMHVAASPKPAQACSPRPGNNQGLRGTLTPPHSSVARSYDNSYYHNHDLVANSMGTGGWVFKIC